jgi:hypothetical protein
MVDFVCLWTPLSNFDFWTTLVVFGDNCDFPWLCIGDFNAITAQHDKLGGRPFPMFSRNTFSSFMNQFGMIDLVTPIRGLTTGMVII